MCRALFVGKAQSEYKREYPFVTHPGGTSLYVHIL